MRFSPARETINIAMAGCVIWLTRLPVRFDSDLNGIYFNQQSILKNQFVSGRAVHIKKPERC